MDSIVSRWCLNTECGVVYIVWRMYTLQSVVARLCGEASSIVSDSEFIHEEIRQQQRRCICPSRFPVHKLDTGKYKVSRFVCWMIYELFTENLSRSYRASPAIWDHSVLPATPHGWMRPTVNPATCWVDHVRYVRPVQLLTMLYLLSDSMTQLCLWMNDYNTHSCVFVFKWSCNNKSQLFLGVCTNIL